MSGLKYLWPIGKSAEQDLEIHSQKTCLLNRSKSWQQMWGLMQEGGSVEDERSPPIYWRLSHQSGSSHTQPTLNANAHYSAKQGVPCPKPHTLFSIDLPSSVSCCISNKEDPSFFLLIVNYPFIALRPHRDLLPYDPALSSRD